MLGFAAPAAAEPVSLVLPIEAWSQDSADRAHPYNQWSVAMHTIEHRLDELRCLLPDGRVFGSFRKPGAEVCFAEGAVRLCATAQFSWSGQVSSASIEISPSQPSTCRRPGD
jgi:hypothetical protein